ncbi:putative B3 domain-containing protein Os06g0632500 isoform X1 [Elaeis guineensis]|uniref:B3 domain-containing protein Os06g0632500 n=1 Tax=Elaeis guineensis var. tenera TaxID=51953 RepID=A0A6I9SE72_ELAGV|nr:putative B3 domain-containing protein Os06g0632500 [Elaeis guineensis]
MAAERSQGAHEPEFFKVLLQSSFKTLLIPPKFTQHLVNGDRQKATIVSPLGKFWHVNLQREGHKMFFGSGWEDFVKAHGLSVGHFLVFRYQGNMVFTIKIFDKSGCLKEYDSIASTHVTKREVDVDVEILDVAPKDIEPVNWTSSSKKGRSKKSASTNSHGQRDIRKSSGSKRPNSRNRVPYFERIVRRSSFISMRMSVPRVFCLSNGLTTLYEITLIDQKQRQWPVLFLPGSRGGHLGRGWRFFSKANNLKEGDTCIFKLVSKKVMRVRIVRRGILGSSKS